MKKILFLTLVLTLGISAIANNRVLTDYVDNDKIFDILKNDTITLQYFGSENQFKFVEPDTIWKKRVKRPKENKHYYLQWYQPMDQTNGIPLNTQSGITKQFIFQNIVLHENGGKIELFLYDLEINREIVFTPCRSICIRSESIENSISSMLKDSVIYYKRNYPYLQDVDEFYKKTSLKSIQYQIDLCPYADLFAEKSISVGCTLQFNDDITGYISNDGIFLSNDGIFLEGTVEAITKNEFLEHNALVQENMKQDSIVRLARVFDREAVYNNQKYGFEGDTMAIVEYYDLFTKQYFSAYAYGKEYTIKIEDSITEKIHFLDTTDLRYLEKRRNNGYPRRIAVAKLWDKKNDSLIIADCIKDTSDIVWATLNYEPDVFFQQVDEEGKRINVYVDKPSKGQRIPIFYYGDGGGMNVPFWTFYKGKLFVINSVDHLTFENDSDRLYLMRSGNRNLKERMKRAAIADYADRFVELLKKEEEKEKKIKNLIKRKIFLLSQDKAYGDYDWCGINPKFLNCYSKTIKYIDCLVVPYNKFDDVQSDDYGRSSKEIRCIGPFEPGEIASWRFDDMFKNENGIIKRFKITNIKITFIDNSTITYKGLENVKKHYEYVYDL